MAWWQLGRNRREPAADAAPNTPPMIRSAQVDDAWRDLPVLQRTLADSLHPVAITDEFRDSLASYADPSFVAPLAHQVDPEAGGLVEGLVSPGLPYSHPSGPELAVPSSAKPAASRKAVPSTDTASRDTPSVQRRAISSSSANLPTVAMELPGIESPAPESEPRSSGPEITEPSEVVITSGAAPLTEEASATEWAVTEASAVDHGSKVAAPATPARELPVVARLVDKPAETRLPLTRGSTAAPQTSESSPAPTSRDLPIVGRHEGPTTQSGPVGGFVEAIAAQQPVPAEMRPEPVNPSAEPVDISTEPVDLSAEPVEARNARPSTSSGRMEESAPTLGVQLTRSPLTVQRAPLTERVSPLIERRVQRVEFMTRQVTPTQRPSAATHTPSPNSQSVRNSPGPVAAEAAVTTTTVQRLPSQDGKRGSNPAVEHSLAVPRRETQTQGTVPAAPVQRLETFEPVASTATTVPEPTVRAEPATPGMDASAQYAPIKPAVQVTPVSSTVADVLTEPAAPEVPMGPAVIPEPWTAPARASAAEPIAPARHSSPPTVSRLAAATPAYPTPRSTGSSRTVAVGRAIPQATAHATSSQSEPAVAMSFSSMFDSADHSETRSEAEDGFTSVQLQSAGDSALPAAEPTIDTPPTPPVSSSAAPAASGTKPADLDELARRLYEPLTARLRAELWLDRERAGVTSDL
jgi:hypothetical protein